MNISCDFCWPTIPLPKSNLEFAIENYLLQDSPQLIENHIENVRRTIFITQIINVYNVEAIV